MTPRPRVFMPGGREPHTATGEEPECARHRLMRGPRPHVEGLHFIGTWPWDPLGTRSPDCGCPWGWEGQTPVPVRGRLVDQYRRPASNPCENFPSGNKTEWWVPSFREGNLEITLLGWGPYWDSCLGLPDSRACALKQAPRAPLFCGRRVQGLQCRPARSGHL